MAFEIELGEQVVTYSIRESKRARHLRFKIDPQNGLQVVVPAGTEVKGLDRLLRKRQGWILKHLGRIEAAKSNGAERQFITVEQLIFLGEPHELEVIATRYANRATVARQASTVRVRLKADVREASRSAEVRIALESWYRAQARQYIRERAASLAGAYGFQYGRITIRGQRTRWGSCSSKGNLNFNWRLMMAPPAAIDYVIIHELCHLREPNHSPAFWALVAKYCPDYEHWKRWLKDNNAQLYL